MPNVKNKHKLPFRGKRVKTNSNITMSLYDMNKQLMKGLPALEDEKWNDEKENFFLYLNKTNNNYYLLYGKEIGYFTLFHKVPNGEDIFNVLKECLSGVGVIKSFDFMEETNAYEFWVEPPEKEPTMLAFFPYDTGVIDIGT